MIRTPPRNRSVCGALGCSWTVRFQVAARKRLGPRPWQPQHDRVRVRWVSATTFGWNISAWTCCASCRADSCRLGREPVGEQTHPRILADLGHAAARLDRSTCRRKSAATRVLDITGLQKDSPAQSLQKLVPRSRRRGFLRFDGLCAETIGCPRACRVRGQLPVGQWSLSRRRKGLVLTTNVIALRPVGPMRILAFRLRAFRLDSWRGL